MACVVQSPAQPLTVGDPDDGQVVHAVPTGLLGHRCHAIGVQQLPIELHEVTAGPVPLLEVPELGTQDDGLHGVQPAVRAQHDVVVVRARSPTVIAQGAESVVEHGIGGDHGAGVTEGAQVLPGIEAEAPGHAVCPGTPHAVRRTVRLRGVLDEQEPVPLGVLRDRPHVRHLSVQVHRDHGLGRRHLTAAIESTVRRRVSGSTSAKRGSAPASTTASTVATNVFAGTMT